LREQLQPGGTGDHSGASRLLFFAMRGLSLIGIGCDLLDDTYRAFWLTRRAGGAGDPSLRLKNGSVQDDTAFLGWPANCISWEAD
jgi:hypothetical protein